MLDAHCHFWSLGRGDYGWLETGGPGLDPIRRDFGLADYPGGRPVIAVQAAPSVAETRFLLDLARGSDSIRGVVGWVDLADAGAADAVRDLAADPLLRGLRPMLQDIADTDWLVNVARPEALAAMAGAGLVFDALVTERHLPMLARFADANPDLAIVIDHAAKPQPGPREGWRAGMRALARDPRIYCKLSGLLTELSPEERRDPLPALQATLADLLDWFGPDRLIWGSDWPVVTLAAPLIDWLALSEDLTAGLSAPERAAIFGGNAARVYGVAP